jgi:CBS domain-containing protein
MAIMRRNRWSSLPVVKNGHLVGIVNETQFMAIAGQLLEEKLRE